MLLISGSANPSLASKIATKLKQTLANSIISQFPDGETKVVITGKVRDQDVIIIQATSPPVNDNLIQLCLLVNAARKAGARKIIVIAAYLGYMRQDFAACRTGEAQSTQVIATILNALAIDHLITLDLHANNTADLFTCGLVNLDCQNIFANDLIKKNLSNFVIVAPDIGGVQRAEKFAKLLNVDLAVAQKMRTQPNTTLINILATVHNRDCIILDDIIDSASTIYNVATALKKHGANKVYVYATHAVLSKNALQTIEQSACDEIVLTDTIELQNTSLNCNKLRIISVNDIFAEKIIALLDTPRNICQGDFT